MAWSMGLLAVISAPGAGWMSRQWTLATKPPITDT